MSGGAFILAINLSVAGLLSAAFLGIAVYDRARMSARWLALAYALGGAYFLFELGTPLLPPVRIGSYFTYLAAVTAFALGLARIYDTPMPWRPVAGITLAAIFMWPFMDSMSRDDLLRLFLYQMPYAAMQAVGAAIVWRHGPGRLPDRMLAVLLTLTSVYYLSKPGIAQLAGGVGGSPQDYMNTLYALFSQSTGTILGLSVALTVLMILLREVLSDVLEQSRRDKLSGLLNRRGFEESRDRAMRQRGLNGLPVSLVLCDLDRFKEVNDTYGHDSGDQVIQAFARLLEASVGQHQYCARIGGEEFAILLPGSNLAAGRIMAEGIRLAFSHAAIPGIPAGAKLTASFGVAEAQTDESAEMLFRRADRALYEAKRGGRDRVCISLAPRGRSEAASA